MRRPVPSRCVVALCGAFGVLVSPTAARRLGFFLKGAQGFQHQRDEAQFEEGKYPVYPIVRFDGSSWAKRQSEDSTELSITRQGKLIYRGADMLLDFGEDHLYKQYVATLADNSGRHCSIPVYIRGYSASLCSTALFTQKNLGCEHMGTEEAQDAFNYAHLAPGSDRGFGVEFEFVARKITPQWWDMFKPKVRHLLESGALTNHGRRVAHEDALPKISHVAKVAAVSECFHHAIRNPDLAVTPCSMDTDCSFSQYCLDCGRCLRAAAANLSSAVEDLLGDANVCGACSVTEGKFCKPRDACRQQFSDVLCPPIPALWKWEPDSSVVPLSEREATFVGGDMRETEGSPFEVTSPGPPNVLFGAAGMRNVMEMLTTLKHIGIQAGPSQGFHVHINVANSKAPGEKLTLEGVAAVWVAWAKFQLVIDEMLSPGRIYNPYATSLVLRDCEIDADQTSCQTNPCACVKRFFLQMRKHVQSISDSSAAGLAYERQDALDFCNAALVLPGSSFARPCIMRYPKQRYFSINLVPLPKYGTIEFRCHSASVDHTRIGRWVQFLVAFVEYFGRGAGFFDVAPFLRDDGPLDAYSALRTAQQEATAFDLFNALHKASLIDEGMEPFYVQRQWERNDATCKPSPTPNYVPAVPTSKCEVEHGFQFAAEAAVRSTVQVNASHIVRTMKVKTPERATVGDYINIAMPEGDYRTIKVPPNGARSFTFEDHSAPNGSELLWAQTSSLNRCCCSPSNTKCLWFPWHQLSSDDTCPRVAEKRGALCTMDKYCFMAKECWHRENKWRHRSGRCNVDDEQALFQGSRCEMTKKMDRKLKQTPTSSPEPQGAADT